MALDGGFLIINFTSRMHFSDSYRFSSMVTGISFWSSCEIAEYPGGTGRACRGNLQPSCAGQCSRTSYPPQHTAKLPRQKSSLKLLQVFHTVKYACTAASSLPQMLLHLTHLRAASGAHRPRSVKDQMFFISGDAGSEAKWSSRCPPPACRGIFQGCCPAAASAELLPVRWGSLLGP